VIPTLLAGLVLVAVGGFGAWLLTTRFPSARFMQTGYVLMGTSGIVFMVWGLAKNLALGVAATALLGCGALIGVLGALRRELRGR
jgi:hypothetical protein